MSNEESSTGTTITMEGIYTLDETAAYLKVSYSTLLRWIEAYTLYEAAKYLKVSYNTLWRWIKAGTFPAFKLGRFWRVYGRDLLTLNEEETM